MTYKLFLDDKRNPVHCVTYMQARIGIKNPIYLQNDWLIARNYTSFVNTIESMGLPEFISFDHDLADEHYKDLIDSGEVNYNSYTEKTGYDCAKWLVGYCIDHKLSLPEIAVHSMNPVGTNNIINYLNQGRKWTKQSSKGK